MTAWQGVMDAAQVDRRRQTAIISTIASQTPGDRRNRESLYPEGVFPFAYPVLTDHLSGRTGGRLARCTTSKTCPKNFDANSANEYWVKAGSLLHTDSRGNDLRDPDNVRFYLISGLSHGVGNVTSRGQCQQFLNPTSPYPALRALLTALDQWVVNGTEPPPSQVPRQADKTAVMAVPRPGHQTGVVPQAALGWPTIPGVAYTGVVTSRYYLTSARCSTRASSRTFRRRCRGAPPIRISCRNRSRWQRVAGIPACRRLKRRSRRRLACAAPLGVRRERRLRAQRQQSPSRRRRPNARRRVIRGCRSRSATRTTKATSPPSLRAAQKLRATVPASRRCREVHRAGNARERGAAAGEHDEQPRIFPVASAFRRKNILPAKPKPDSLGRLPPSGGPGRLKPAPTLAQAGERRPLLKWL